MKELADLRPKMNQPDMFSGRSPEYRVNTGLMLREFYQELFNVTPPDEITQDPENFRVLVNSFQHLQEASTTLYPKSESNNNDFGAYKKQVDGARRQLSLLQRKYTEGMQVSEIAQQDGVSVGSLKGMQRKSYFLLRSLLEGNPTPGMMDGSPIQALRELTLRVLQKNQLQFADNIPYQKSCNNIQEAYDHTQKRLELGYKSDDLLVSDLPINHQIKRRLLNAQLFSVADIDANPNLYRNVAAQSIEQIGFVINALIQLE